MHGWQFLPECQCAFETPKGLRGHDLAKWWGKEPAYFLLPVQPLCPPGSPAKPQDCLGTWSRAFPPFLSPVIKRQIHLLSPKPVILRLHSSSHSPTGFAETVSEIIVLGRGQAHAFLTRSQVMPLLLVWGPCFQNHWPWMFQWLPYIVNPLPPWFSTHTSGRLLLLWTSDLPLFSPKSTTILSSPTLPSPSLLVLKCEIL